MSVSTPTPSEPTIDFKNRWLAGVLALLLPGLGHFYQGRTFKAAIYCICILGLFFTGQALGEWKVVYLSDSEAGGRIVAGRGIMKRLLQGYAAQFPVGVFAWPAIVQSSRYQSENPNRIDLHEPLEEQVRGELLAITNRGPMPIVSLAGTVRLHSERGLVRGTFTGSTDDGRPIEFALSSLIELGRRISANEERTLRAEVETLPDRLDVPPNTRDIVLDSSIRRPFIDRYQVPLGEQGEDRLTAELGGRLEIAYVFTWIAGLLNVLAIWDALDGPAYGYGDESERKRKGRRRKEDEEPGSPAGRKLEPAGRPA